MKQPFELKGSLFTLTVLHLYANDLEAIELNLAKKVQQAPGFFNNIPVVIDLASLPEHDIPDFPGLVAVLNRHGLIGVAARNGSEVMRQHAMLAGLPALASTRNSASDSGRDVVSAQEEAESEGKQTETAASVRAPVQEDDAAASGDSADNAGSRRSRLVTQPVRSGQQIYAQGSDLIVVSAVSAGAEVLADGSVHVYGPLRGRALAGVKGDSAARIFCQSLEAELVSIAGNYRILEEVDDVYRGKQMQIYLDQERLVIEPLNK